MCALKHVLAGVPEQLAHRETSPEETLCEDFPERMSGLLTLPQWFAAGYLGDGGGDLFENRIEALGFSPTNMHLPSNCTWTCRLSGTLG